MLPDPGREGAEIPGAKPSRPLRLRQGLLEHESVDVDQAVLKQMQREHADLVVFAAVAGEFDLALEEHRP